MPRSTQRRPAPARIAKPVPPDSSARPESSHRYRVYVIELDPAVRDIRKFRERNPQGRPDRPCVYVGSTWHEPQVRFLQHKSGIKANGYARRFGIRLRWRLMAQRQTYRTRNEALASEQRCAEKLRRRGYWVWQG
jgi:hypothetical protein